MLELITDPAKITPQWLTQALRCSGHLAAGEVSIASYSMIGTGKMGDNARFELTYSDASEDAPATVIAKLPAADETARAMAGARGLSAVAGAAHAASGIRLGQGRGCD